MEPSLSDRLVLLVDDELSWLKGASAWLRENEAGFAVMAVESAEKALRLVERHRPDLLISDLRLPGMSGLELLLHCRKRYPGMRFMAMSAYGTPDLEERLRQCGAVRFLHKPIDLAELEQTISQVLRSKPEDPTAGFLNGISVAGFVQLLNLERQTAVVRMLHPDGRDGWLAFMEGELWQAGLGDKSGEEAALELLAWEGAELVLERAAFYEKRAIERPLGFLLMEAARRKDEARAGG
ncbi:MAG: response regulator [Myxococcales bacterium]|nr:response regulator [Myxococcales bacterium]